MDNVHKPNLDLDNPIPNARPNNTPNHKLNLDNTCGVRVLQRTRSSYPKFNFSVSEELVPTQCQSCINLMPYVTS